MRGGKEHFLGFLPPLTLLQGSSPRPVPCAPGSGARAAAASYLEKIYKPLSTERTRQLSSGLLRKIDQPRLGLILAFSFLFFFSPFSLSVFS